MADGLCADQMGRVHQLQRRWGKNLQKGAPTPRATSACVLQVAGLGLVCVCSQLHTPISVHAGGSLTVTSTDVSVELTVESGRNACLRQVTADSFALFVGLDFSATRAPRLSHLPSWARPLMPFTTKPCTTCRFSFKGLLLVDLRIPLAGICKLPLKLPGFILAGKLRYRRTGAALA